MSKKNMNNNMEVVEMEAMDNEMEIIEEVAETTKKPKWSLKKKLMLGGGILVGLVVGAVALGAKKTNAADETSDDSEEDAEEEVVDAGDSNTNIAE